MKKAITTSISLLLTASICLTVHAQKKIIMGTIKNSITKETVNAVSIIKKNSAEGTYSNDKGNFRLAVSGSLPITITISSIGFETIDKTINSATELLNIELQPSYDIQKTYVLAPTRTPIRFLETPVTTEQIDVSKIHNSPSANFYESIASLKGVDMTTAGLNFRTISTRGFNNSGNLRINQFVDGMDNQAPGMNFPIGNLFGMSELDVETVELLPGASSALYGSGGLNGTVLMNSKNPFKYQGLSLQVKEGIMHIDKSQGNTSPYHDISLRLAKAYKRFAFKINTQFIQAKDWQANDMSNLSRTNLISKQIPGDRKSDPNYDGVNVYGDEVNADMYTTTQSIINQAVEGFKTQFKKANGRDPNAGEIDNSMSKDAQYKTFWLGMKNGLIPKKRVSRTGYDERDMVNYNTYNLKVSGGLYYKLTDAIEASLVGYWGTGTTVYTGSDRYSFKDIKMGQYKAELKHKNWLIRAYTTQENAGQAYNTTALASYINESWKPSTQWFPEYLANFAGARLNGQSESAAYVYARQQADIGRLVPGTDAFNKQFDRLRKTPVSDFGALFLDKTDLWQYDGQLNLSDKIKVFDLLVGADYKRYVLNSEGTLFADTAGRIKIPEWGAFIQVQKSLFKDVLKLSASGRYDKSKNFTGQFTPRITALVKVADDNNIRLSYQTGYRFPATQDQYINLFTGTTTLMGSLPEFMSYYHFNTNPVYTAQSISRYRETSNTAVLEKAIFKKLEPEKVYSTEIGYKGLITKSLLVDAFLYFSKYKNFIGQTAVGQPSAANTFKDDLLSSYTTRNFAYVQNINQNVSSHGYGIGIEYSIARGYVANVNVSSDQVSNVPADYTSFYNTPKYRFNISIGNEQFWKQFGFNTVYRWQDKVNWEGTFGTGLVPAYGTLDAQLSYRFRGTKNLMKFGATNLLNKYYYSAFGNPRVGGLYYVSFGFNVL